MLIYHTSDLHIGKTVNDFSMLGDQHHILHQMLEHMRLERPGAFIIAGDVYDKQIPGVEAVRLFDWFLGELAALGAATFIIAGNHDSADRLCFASSIIAGSHIYMEGGYSGSVARYILEDEFGEVAFHLLPFFRPSAVNRYAEKDISGYDSAFAHIVSGLETSDRRNVLVAHQFMVYQGEKPERCDSESVGGTDSVDVGPAAGFDYVALGHLHGPQQVGREHIRYAGSPIKYSFSESRHSKSMARIELGPEGSRDISLIPLIPLHDMRRITGPIEMLTSAEVVAGANPEDYIHATLTDEDAPDAMKRLRSVYPNIMSLDFDNARSRAQLQQLPDGGERLSSMDMFCNFYKEVNGADMDELQRNMAAELLGGIGDGL